MSKDGDGSTAVTLMTPNILKCNITQFFWISWDDSSVQFGKGRFPGNFNSLTYQERDGPAYEIRAVGLSSAEMSDITWQYSSVEGT